MSEKLCDLHESSRRKSLRGVIVGAAILIFLLLLTILIVWAVLKPKKPQFTLQDATIFVLAVPAANVISATVQVTVLSRNPNSRIGIYYEHLRVSASYHDQQITYPTSIPPAYQGHKDASIWSPFVYGNNVPVAPYTGVGLSRDRADGAVPLVIKINGHVKWRVGGFVSGRYHLHVTCPAFIPVGAGGFPVGNAVKYQLSQRCSVNV